MEEIQYKTFEECDKAVKLCRMLGAEVPEWLRKQYMLLSSSVEQGKIIDSNSFAIFFAQASYT